MNLEKIKEQKRQWYIENIDKIKKQRRQWYLENRDRILKKQKEYGKEHYFKNKDKIQEYRKEWYLKNKDKIKSINLKIKYGISLDQYNKMLDDQNGCCKVCGNHESNFKKGLFVDHCHKTDKIRGLLCNGCNAGLGQLKEDTKIMQKLIEYVKEHNE